MRRTVRTVKVTPAMRQRAARSALQQSAKAIRLTSRERSVILRNGSSRKKT